MEKVNIQLIKIFGPSVLKVSIPETIVNNLNNYIDEIIKNKERSKELDIGERLVGDVTQEFEIEQKIIPFLERVSLNVVATETESITMSTATPANFFCSFIEIPSLSKVFKSSGSTSSKLSYLAFPFGAEK